MLIFCQKKKTCWRQSKKCYRYRNANKDRFIWGHADLAANFYEYLNTTWFNYKSWRGSISFAGSCACSSERKFLQFCFFLQLYHTKVRIKFQSWPPDGTCLPCPIGLVHHHRCSQPLVRHCPVSTSLEKLAICDKDIRNTPQGGQCVAYLLERAPEGKNS